MSDTVTPKKLWLDDRRPAPEGWTWVKTFDEFVTQMLAADWDEASLDHDLADWHYAAMQGKKGDDHDYGRGRQEKTGYHCCLWMVENGRYPRKVSVHSMNPVGAAAMHALLSDRHPDGAGAVTRRLPY